MPNLNWSNGLVSSCRTWVIRRLLMWKTSKQSDRQVPAGRQQQPHPQNNLIQTLRSPRHPPASNLTPLGQHRYVSPAGLYYTMGPDQEHRLVHIMRHSKDDASRPVHGVFLGDREQILETIDEAFELTKEPSPRVKSEPDKEHPSRVAYTVDMQKKIGYEGGRHGRERGNPGLEKVTLVIDNQDQIITTYPSR